MGRGERRAPCRCVCRRREKRPRVLGTRGTPSAQARRSFPRTFRRGTDRSPRGAVASHAASPQSSLSPSSRRGLMNSHRGSYVAEAARSTGHGDGGARGRVRREGARRRATRERTVADRNGRDFLRRGVDATSWGGGERADAPDTSNPNRSKSPLAATSTTLRRAGPGRDASARGATSAETVRRAVASTDGTARAASPAAAPSASASASASRPVSWRAARARRRSTARAARSAWSARGSEGRREGERRPRGQ